MTSSPPASDRDIASEVDPLDIETFLERIETFMIEAIRRDVVLETRITEIQDLMREQNTLNNATETARQEERRRRNSWRGWGKWIALGFLALVLDNLLGVVSLGFAICWHKRK
ncbi:hypothetical protein BPOR_0069g00060 [Botrytis porri]|uniref:Uncharacterized protein n=1 Tax=Botrytis porri TaxID=87229 RepID=A0A4Z1L0G1_9HELO|nr:hypothetical protein BPOR_0069g00060 [Botrytis porri]